MDTAEREGGDITAAHMINQNVEPSLIKQYIEAVTVFVTGATGYLGKLLVEKLLRSCPGIRKIYVLIRDKPNQPCEERFKAFFESALFDRLKRENVQALQKVSMIQGDCMMSGLGLNSVDLQILLRDVNCVFHCASTMKFNEKLSTAALTNVGGTKEFVKLAQKMYNLRSFVYVSTAFLICPNNKIQEVFYEPTMTVDDLLTIVGTLKEDVLDTMTPILLGEWPNTYTFTKAVAEEVIRSEGEDLPIAIVRPSMVIGTVKEPVAGWVQNFNGVSGVIVGVSLGYIRTLQCKPNNFVDMVPADYVVNCMIAAAWDIAMRKGSNLNNEIPLDNIRDIPIYNCVSTPDMPIRWSSCINLALHHFVTTPLTRQAWHVIFIPRSSTFAYMCLHYLLHLTPAVLADFFCYCTGRNCRILKKYAKIEKFLNGLRYFTTQEWYFKNNNLQQLWEKMNSEDKRFFEFSMKTLDWDFYFHTYVRGLRVYLLRDSLETIHAARIRCQRLRMLNHCTLIAIGLVLLFSLYLKWFW
ncbi:hypothetical protein RI129_012981 [Pyrocoelia pectoralis]|uniref:Fatty acyl-CoA reductase n=1 Tax=Pyrocoelia pectoralis TaxID=417401 RepID=A0AAN7V511_9COLE